MKKFTSLQDLIICMGLKLFYFTIHFSLTYVFSLEFSNIGFEEIPV